MFAYKALIQVRQAGINAELYPEPVKMKKQMKYANARNVPYVALIGSHELENSVITIKDMTTGSQNTLSVRELIVRLS